MRDSSGYALPGQWSGCSSTPGGRVARNAISDRVIVVRNGEVLDGVIQVLLFHCRGATQGGMFESLRDDPELADYQSLIPSN